MADEMYYEVVEEKYDEHGCFVGVLEVTAANGWSSGPSRVHFGDKDKPPTKEDLEAAFSTYAEDHRAQAYPPPPVAAPAFAGTFTKGVVAAATHAKVADAPDDRDPDTFLRKRAVPAQPGIADMPADVKPGRAKG